MPMEVLATLRVSTQYSGNSHWHTGTIRLFFDHKKWKLAIRFNSQNKDYCVWGIRKDSIKAINWKNGQFWLGLTEGNILRFKDPLTGKPADLVKMLEEIHKGLAKVPVTRPTAVLSPMHPKVPPSPKGAAPRIPLSPKQQTARSQDIVRQTPDRNRTFNSSYKSQDIVRQTPDRNKIFNSSYKSPKRDMRHLLETSQEKSAETLRNFNSSHFYGSKSAPSRNYGAFGLSSVSVNRRPRLSSNPESTDRGMDVKYRWRKSMESPQNTILQGFSNLGNTCYMNAILQSLFNLLTFTDDVLRLAKRLHNPQDKLQSAGYLSVCLSKLVLAKSSLERQRMCLRAIKNAISASAKRFSGNDQHDAHEFLCQVLDQLKEEVIGLNKKNGISDSKSSESDTSPPNEPSRVLPNPTTQNFEFEVLHTITCLECGAECQKAEIFHDLSLDMARKRRVPGQHSLQDALDSFFRPETIEYTCAQCPSSQAHVEHKFTRLPRVLILHLKRYSHLSGSLFHAKCGTSIDLPKYLSLQPHSTEMTSPPFPPRLDPRTMCPTLPKERSPNDFRNTRRRLQYQDRGKVYVPDSRRSYTDFKRTPPATDYKQKSHTITDEEDKTRRRSKEDQDIAQALELSLMENYKNTDSDDELLESVIGQSTLEQTQTKEGIPQYDGTSDDKAFPDVGQAASDDDGRTQYEGSNDLKMALEMSLRDYHDNQEDAAHSPGSIDLTPELLSQEFPEPSADDENHPLEHNNDLACSQGFPVTDVVGRTAVPSQQTGLERKRKYSAISDKDEDAIPMEIGTPPHEEIPENDEPKKGIKYVKAGGTCSGQISGNCDRKLPSPSSLSAEPAHTSNRSDISKTSYPLFNRRQKNSRQSLKESQAKPTEVMDITGKLSANDLVSETPRLSSREDFETLGEGDARGDVALSDEDVVVLQMSPNNKSAGCGQSSDVDGIVNGLPGENHEQNEDKENQMPPEVTKSTRDEEDSEISFKRRQEQEEEELQKALQLSLMEEEEREKREQEELRQATELSLKDAGSYLDALHEDDDEDASVEDTLPLRTKEQQNLIQENSRTGELPYSYRLTSVVSHLGSSSVAGHYVSDALDIQQGEWLRYNDSHVTKTTELNVCMSRQRTGYIFFYMSKEVLEELEEFHKSEAVQRRSSDLGTTPERPLSV